MKQRDTNLPRQAQAWPQDWDIHILNACDLYFDDKDINFLEGASFSKEIASSNPDLDKKLRISGVELRLIFNITKHYYGVSIKHKAEETVALDIYYLTKNFVSIDQAEQAIKIVPDGEIRLGSHSVILVSPVKKVWAINAYDSVKKIEKVINKDYPGRENPPGPGGDNPEPLSPTDPLDFVQGPFTLTPIDI